MLTSILSMGYEKLKSILTSLVIAGNKFLSYRYLIPPFIEGMCWNKYTLCRFCRVIYVLIKTDIMCIRLNSVMNNK